MANTFCRKMTLALLLSLTGLSSFSLAHSTGHGEQHEHAEAELRGSGDDPVTLESLDRRIHELNGKMTAHEDTIRVRDILGGIGFIVGLSGIAFYFSGRKRDVPSSDTRSSDVHSSDTQ